MIEARYVADTPFEGAPYNTRLYVAGTEDRHVCPRPTRKGLRRVLTGISHDVSPNGDCAPLLAAAATALIQQGLHDATNRIVNEMREDRARVAWEMRDG